MYALLQCFIPDIIDMLTVMSIIGNTSSTLCLIFFQITVETLLTEMEFIWNIMGSNSVILLIELSLVCFH